MLRELEMREVAMVLGILLIATGIMGQLQTPPELPQVRLSDRAVVQQTH